MRLTTALCRCECEMDGAFKVQLLRVVLSFADRDGDNMKNKRLLLSSADRKRQARLLDSMWPAVLVPL